MNCQFCEKEIANPRKANTYIMGKDYKLCDGCQKEYNKTMSVISSKSKEGEAYFSKLLAKNDQDANIAVVLKYLSGQKISNAEIDVVDKGLKEIPADLKEKISQNESAAVQPYIEETSSGTGLIVAGIIFLILAVILYVISVNNDYGVANIQTTVFSAAAFVSAIVCFAVKTAIKALKK